MSIDPLAPKILNLTTDHQPKAHPSKHPCALPLLAAACGWDGLQSNSRIVHWLHRRRRHQPASQKSSVRWLFSFIFVSAEASLSNKIQPEAKACYDQYYSSLPLQCHPVPFTPHLLFHSGCFLSTTFYHQIHHNVPLLFGITL